jgi:hypothetical protein
LRKMESPPITTPPPPPPEVLYKLKVTIEGTACVIPDWFIVGQAADEVVRMETKNGKYQLEIPKPRDGGVAQSPIMRFQGETVVDSVMILPSAEVTRMADRDLKSVAKWGQLQIVYYEEEEFDGRRVYRFRRADDPEFKQSRAEFFRDFWNNCEFLCFLIGFLIRLFRERQQQHRLITTADGIVIENLLPPSLGGLPDFIEGTNMERYELFEELNAVVITPSTPNNAAAKYALVRTDLTKSAYYQARPFERLIYKLQNLVKLLSRVNPPPGQVLLDLFPPTLVPNEDVDRWFCDTEAIE